MIASFSALSSVHARQGATDPIPRTSNGSINSGRNSGGGGGAGGSTTTTTPTTTQP